MIPVSDDYKRELIAGNRNYVIKVDVTLKGSLTTDFTLTNEEIWDGGITIDEAISSDDSFDIGAAIVGSLKVVINNISGNYSLYDFYDAKLVLWLGVTGDLDEYDVQRYYRIGFYVVDKPTYNGSLITLDCLDNMTWFDVPFSGVNFPTTANTTTRQLINAICSHVGVSLGTTSFPFYDAVITKKMLADISKQEINCREVIQYIAQRCCCYCKINTAGQLALNWYDKYAIIGLSDYDGGTYNTTTTPYSDGCELDGGSFNPWDGDDADGGTFTQLLEKAYISQNFDINVATDDVVVTGVRVRNNTSKDDTYDELWVDHDTELTHERYVLIIDNNPFITASTAGNIANTIGNILKGLPIRGYTATSLSDFSYETGDMAVIYDFRGNRYYSWITHLTFTTNNSESFSCGVQSLRKRSEERFSGTVKTLAEANENASAMLSDYDNAVKAMDELAQNAIGFNEYVYGSGSSKIMYRYDGASFTPTGSNPKFPNANNVFKITGDGVFVARRTNGDIAADGTCTYSNGYDANSGTAILNLIYAQGLSADWINAGHISANRIQSGTLTLGGNNNTNGVCSVRNSSNTEKVRLDNNGLTATAGKINGNLEITNDGSLGITGSSSRMNSALFKNGGFEIDVQSAYSSSSWGGLAFGTPSYNRRHWGNTSCVLWDAIEDNDGYAQGGFFVCHCAPNESPSNYSKVTFNQYQIIRGGSSVARFDEDRYDTWNGGSDERMKEDIEEINSEESASLIKALKPKSFRFRKDSGRKDTKLRHSGFIAQDVQKLIPKNNGLVDKLTDESDMLCINYTEIIPHLVNVAQKQQEEIDLLKKELAELKARVK